MIAKYLRFSNDDGKVGDSESIKNQRDLIDRYISVHDDLQDNETVEFLDDGFTGTNFQRPGFMRMLDAAKSMEVTCIIVKDFSRLGRDYIEVSDYIDQIFPFLGIRFIAINEQYDSKTAPAALGIDMAMQNIIYDLYSKDLSKKVRSARKSLMQKGAYIAPFAIYGYTNKVEKKRLVVDPTAAEVVRRMFEYAANGEKARAIAIRLNDEGILPPNAYNKSKSTNKMYYIPMDSAAIWTGDIVRRILQDERYTGTMVSGKYTRIKGKAILLPKEEWVVIPGTHEAIVSEDLFNKAQAVFRTRKEIIRPDKPKSILVGMLKCTHCKKTLVFESRYRRRFYCHSFNMGIGCEQAVIDEPEFINTIFAAIKTKLELVDGLEQSLADKRKYKIAEMEAERREYERRLSKQKHLQSTILECFLDGEISKEDYQAQKLQVTRDIEEITKHLSALEKRNINTSEFAESHRPFFGQETLTREMLQALIKEIRVTTKDKVEIVWKFQDFYADLYRLVL